MTKPDKQIESRPKRKAPKTAWKKGQSGNPAGRKKKGFAISERIRAKVTDEDWDKIISKAVTQAKKGDKYSRDFLVDRTEGKPTQPTADVSEGWQEFLDGVFDSEQE